MKLIYVFSISWLSEPFSLYHYYFQWLLQGSSVHWMSNTDSWLDDKRSSLATKHTDRLRRLTICRFVLVNYMLNHLSSKHKFVWCVSYLFAAAWSHVQKRDDSFIKIRSNTTVQQVEPPAEFFFNYGWLSNIFGWYSAQPDLRGQEKMWLNYGWLHNLKLKYG